MGVPAALGDFAWGSPFNVQSQKATGSRTCGPLKEKGPRAPDHEALSPGTLETQEHQRPAAHGTARAHGPRAPGGRVRGATARPRGQSALGGQAALTPLLRPEGRETTGHVTGVWAQPPPVSRHVPVTGEASRPRARRGPQRPHDLRGLSRGDAAPRGQSVRGHARPSAAGRPTCSLHARAHSGPGQSNSWTTSSFQVLVAEACKRQKGPPQ